MNDIHSSHKYQDMLIYGRRKLIEKKYWCAGYLGSNCKVEIECITTETQCQGFNFLWNTHCLKKNREQKEKQ